MTDKEVIDIVWEAAGRACVDPPRVFFEDSDDVELFWRAHDDRTWTFTLPRAAFQHVDRQVLIDVLADKFTTNPFLRDVRETIASEFGA